MKSSIKLIFLALLCLAFAGQASAHATPVSYSPEAASVVQKMPTTVRIDFSERIEEAASGISVYGPDGSLVDIGEAKVNSADERSYSVDIKNDGEGTYTVSWQVVSKDDGHFTKGAFAFSVGKTTGSNAVQGQIQIQHITTIPQAVTMAIELVGQSFLLGILLFLVFLWRPLRRKFKEEISPYKEKIEGRFSAIFIAGVVFILIGVVSFIILKTFDLEQLRPGSFVVTFHTFISTSDGSYALVRGLLSVLAFGIFVAFRKYIWRSEKLSKTEWALIALVCGMVLIRARVSHAAASNFYPAFAIFITALQLLFKELWVGGLVVFSAIVSSGLFRLKNVSPLTFLSTQFSKIMAVCLAGVEITGAYVVWLDLKDPSYLFSTEWGTTFIVLSIFGAVLLALRIYHSLLKKENFLKWFPTTIKLEMFVGIALLFVTSLIIITTPPYATERFTFEQSAVSQNAKLTMVVHPSEPSQFLITIEDAKTGAAITVSNMAVSITNEEKGIGPIVVNTEQRFVGGYVFPRALLTPAGDWKIDISAGQTNNYDATASFNVNPKDVEASRIDPNKRSFGWFEIVCLVAALFITIFAYFLYRFSKNEKVEAEMTHSSLLSWIFSFIGFLVIIAAVWYSYDTFVKSDFQKLCEKNGHFWLQSIPMKDGVALSPDTVTGCFLDVGLYHFADQREYQFFFLRREIIPELSYKPSSPVAGIPTDITLTLEEIKNGQKAGPVTELGINHDRILHVLIVGEDLKTFAHIHSEDLGPITDEMKKNATFPLRYTFPKAGYYALNIDYIVSGIEYTNVIIVNVAGSPKMERLPYLVPINPENFPKTKDFDGYTVTFTAPHKIKAGEKVMLSYYVEKDGKPVTNMEPYLGAAMHVGIIRNDLGRFYHTHGEAMQFGSVWFQQMLGYYFKYHMHFAPDQFGPKIITPPFYTKFTTPGIFTVFGEFKVAGKIIVTDFEVGVGQ